MAKSKRGGRRLSGNPAKAAEQLRFEQYWREVHSQPVPPYRSPTDADWERLEQEGRSKFPECPECGGRLVGNDGEEGADDEGNTVISMVLWCENEDPEDRSAAKPHPITHGMVELETTLR